MSRRQWVLRACRYRARDDRLKVSVFVGPEDGTRQLTGDLYLTCEEWEQFALIFKLGQSELVEEQLRVVVKEC